MLTSFLPFPERILSMIQQHPLFLFLDYDGTLTPIVNSPEKAQMDASLKKVIEDLSKCPDVTMAIVSGRSLADLKKRVGIKSLIYMGNHGLEYEGPYMKHVHPVALALKETMGEINDKLNAVFEGYKGILVENKTLSLSVHYRMLESHKLTQAREMMYAVVGPYLKAQQIMIRQGKKVWEVRPLTDWNKGKMVLWTLGRFTAKFSKAFIPFYFGDDETDEDAFRLLRQKGVTVRVTENPAEASFAQYYLKSPHEVGQILRVFKNSRCGK